MMRSFRLPLILLTTTVVIACRSGAAAPPSPATWSWEWKPAPDQGVPTAELCTFQYGKKWAYAVEIDDGPTSTLTVSQPLLAEYGYSDAPPGISGGTRKPLVGGAAVIVLRTGTPNGTFLNWDQLRQLRERGWGVLNHGYAHAGNGWEPSAALKAPELRRELYWSQALFARELGAAPGHFVYPNGYMAYAPHIGEFGLRSGSRVAGTSAGNVLDPKWAPSDLNRNYLDEGVWVKANDPLAGLPSSPREGEFVIDFTHGMDASPTSPNGLRWRTRLGHLAGRFGEKGDGTMWCAPTSDVVDYTLARRAAKVAPERGRLTLSLAGSAPRSPLTVHLSGIAAGTVLSAPAGGVLYRKGAEAWVTTPPLGAQPADPAPGLKRVYRGPVGSAKLERPTRIAGVRVLQMGKPLAGFRLKVDLLSEGVRTGLWAKEPGDQWGYWHLIPTVPERPAPLASGVEVSTDPSLKEMEVWALDE